MANLSNKVALITGAAQGIGAETARTMAQEGARLILVDVDAVALNALEAELGGERAVAQAADVRELGSIQQAVDAGVARFGRLDLVLANAGAVTHGSIMAGDPEVFQWTIDTNIVGIFHTVRAAMPALIESQGYVLIVSSLAAYVATPGAAAYDTSQAGVERFASVLRTEVAHLGVDVGSAHMSWLETPSVRHTRSEPRSHQRLANHRQLPQPRESSAHTCATAFTQGFYQRRRHVDVPG